MLSQLPLTSPAGRTGQVATQPTAASFCGSTTDLGLVSEESSQAVWYYVLGRPTLTRMASTLASGKIVWHNIMDCYMKFVVNV